MPNKDDRSNNPERIEEIIENTQEKMNEAKSLEEAHGNEMSEKEKQQIEQKNHRREESLEALQEEMKDELDDQNLR
ncbi:small acid-soluble spore protein Tlp [Shouchella patagoniensis]|uniref:small acid-soluble spore protein Tlp n=1 Tax=Shouchella patagoniensis TaxID=228576 RepID=UPI0009955311|nr:small acid-soluble spore protein Tlp [Shouchella patagoniensis]